MLTKILSVRAPEMAPAELERIAVVVSASMGAPARRFHTLHHVAGFPADEGPEFTLAAIFHDLVYVSVDKTVRPELLGPLRRRVVFTPGGIRIRAAAGKDSLYCDLLAVFGFREGMEIGAAQGMNEFLSACAFMDLLGPRIPRESFIAAAACIEATIPFRPSGPGTGVFPELHARLLSLGLSSDTSRKSVCLAVRFANSDVSDFRQKVPALFLNNTWKLLPEIHPHLLLSGTYTITDYRKALHGMEKFFLGLEPERVFHRFGDEPSGEEYREYLALCTENLKTAVRYIQAKLLAAGVLEAAAELTGGDAPLVLFTGDAAAGEGGKDCLKRHLPPLPAPPAARNDPVYVLLAEGRTGRSGFDISNSPLALFLYLRLLPRRFTRSVERVHEYFYGNLKARDFLAGGERDVLKDVILACAEMVPTRAEALRRLGA